MTSKFFLSVFVFFFVVGVSLSLPQYRPTPPSTTYGVTNAPVVRIVRNKDMTASMQLDAVDAFKRAYSHLSANTDRCSIVRQIFLEKYPEYKWHVAMYKAYSVQSIKSIDIKVDNDSYVLFATKK